MKRAIAVVLTLAGLALGLTACHPAQSGIWLSNAELMSRPTSGSAWTALNNFAAESAGTALVCDQNSEHDAHVLAKALVGTRTNNSGMIFAAIVQLKNAIGTEDNCGAMGTGANRWLDVGRNVGAYVIAADVLGMRDGAGSDGVAIQNWIETINSRTLDENNSPYDPITLSQAAWNSGSNAAAQQGFVRSAIGAYLGNQTQLASEWDRFKRYVGDRTATWDLEQTDSTQDTWQRIPSDPVGIVEPGPTKNGCRWDGAIGNDMARIGSYTCTPDFDGGGSGDGQYSWVGLMGAVPAAVILERAGFHAFDHQSDALKRALEFLWDVRQRTGDARWFDGSRANDAIWLVNRFYGTSFLFNGPAGEGQTVGWTDWTHP